MTTEPDRKTDEAKQRLAEALRQNLRRRKDQSRERKATPEPIPAADTDHTV